MNKTKWTVFNLLRGCTKPGRRSIFLQRKEMRRINQQIWPFRQVGIRCQVSGGRGTTLNTQHSSTRKGYETSPSKRNRTEETRDSLLKPDRSYFTDSTYIVTTLTGNMTGLSPAPTPVYRVFCIRHFHLILISSVANGHNNINYVFCQAIHIFTWKLCMAIWLDCPTTAAQYHYYFYFNCIFFPLRYSDI